MNYLKQRPITLIAIFAALLIQACGGSSTKKIAPIVQLEVEPVAVHLIKPADVPAYVETFKQQKSQLDLQFEGEQYPIGLIDISMDDNFIIASYELGYLIIGFDFSKEEPIASLTVVEGDISSEEEPNRILDGTNIEITAHDENYIYSGSVADRKTQGLFTVRLVINNSLIEGGNSTIEVIDDKALVNGDLGTNTYIQVSNLIQNHPEVKTLVLQQISGSINDAINMHTGRLVRNAQLTTYVPENGDVNSGGVDLFAAGFERKYEQGAKLGVHSWCCIDGKPADELGENHFAHNAQLTYFRELLGKELGPEFYFFTINASSFESVHVMTNVELEKYLMSK